MASKALVIKNYVQRTATLFYKKNMSIHIHSNLLLPYTFFVSSKEKQAIKRLCFFTGRSRGILRKFNVSRIIFRKLTHIGDVMGLKKASW